MMLNMTRQTTIPTSVAQHPAAGGLIRLYATSGDLVLSASALAGTKTRRLIPVVDQHGQWVALLRIELDIGGLRLRTEVLGADRKPRAGGWVEAAEDATIELSWELNDQGQCLYLAMNAY